MNAMSRLAPWFLSALLAALLAVTWYASSKKDEEIATIRKQNSDDIAALKKESSDDIAALKKQNDDLASEANSKIALASRRDVPVRAGFRKALLSSGQVIGIANTSDQTIAVMAEIERPSTSSKKNIQLTIDGGATEEIGEQEGWAFVSGDVVTVTQSEHRSIVFTTP
jgi:hypothetical protein